MATQPELRMTISLNVLEHLGINLYSNVPAVLSEIVANAWDADADEVHIEWDRNSGRITIQDDGIGMMPDDINDRFLNVGYCRRDDQPGPTAKGRIPMGRKGIGKLSAFSIAETIDVETVKDGWKSAFRMQVEKIREAVKGEEGNGTYKPELLPIDRISFTNGTRITLDDIRRRQTIRTPQALRKRVARRFSIIGPKHGFAVIIGGKEVVPSDRDYYDKIQYIWTYGDQQETLDLCEGLGEENVDRRDNAIRESPLTIEGWLATVTEVRHLKDEDGDNLNRIAIFVRGKMAQEDMLTDFSERGIYASYLIGELRVDDLDRYDGPGTERDHDAATSSRQRIVEDDDRYRELRKVIAGEMKHIQNRWEVLRRKDGTRKALQIPEVKAWVEGLKAPIRKKAERWLGKLNRIRIDDGGEQRQMMKHAVLAFEVYRINENLEKLEGIGDDNVQAALEIFGELDDLESNLYGQIVKERIEVIRTLQDKIDENAREKVIQQYLFDHLWLLDPSWERTEGSEVMETRVRKLFDDVDAELSEEELKGRLDIAYRKSAGKHVIIELKRPQLRVGILNIVPRQIEKYYTGMRKMLDQQNLQDPIEIVLLLGTEPREWNDETRRTPALGTLRQYHARIVFYDQLLNDAYEAYREYLDRRLHVDRLAKVMQAIDDYAPEDGD